MLSWQIAPLEIHEENLQDVEEQLRFLIHVMEGAKINYMLPTLKGLYSSWIRSELGIMVGVVVPFSIGMSRAWAGNA